MRIFLIADVHGNLEALNSVFADMKDNYKPSFLKNKDNKSDILGNLGDLVGYMTNPNEVVDKVTNIADFNLPGNHDIGVIDCNFSNYNDVAKWALQWTTKNINDKTRNKLEKICENPNLTVKVENAVFAHSTPHNPAIMQYVEHKLDAMYFFFEHAKFKGMHGFVGHRHIPQFYFCPLKRESDAIKVEKADIGFDPVFLRQVRNFPLNDIESSLTVIPSVGQPRDGNPLSGYAIYYPEDKKIEMIRVPYKIESTQNKMLALNFPERLIYRLDQGR